MANINLIDLIMATLGYGCILVFVYYLYKKKEKGKPKPWVILLVIIIGLITFNLEVGSLPFPVFPIGLCLLYIGFLIRKGNWHWYHKYGLAGFVGSYLLFSITLLGQPIQSLFYPQEPATYFARVEHAEIVKTYRHAPDQTIHKQKLDEAISSLTKKSLKDATWIEDLYENTEERFPYHVTGIKPKWGSGLDTMLFVETDGKGWLVTTPDSHYYYRSPTSIFGEGVANE
ncbi:hypothetical protein [Oceanobacillus kapialis]|uniref:hypothetical protein n=1 Tax=Oceanobacillus kapialis TaxID=481353 RepID=UPI00384C7C94